MSRSIRWRLHCRSSPEALFQMLTTDSGREAFWAERSVANAGSFRLRFPDGTEERCEVVEAVAPSRFAFRYFGSDVLITLDTDGRGGTDLELINSGVTAEDYEEVHAGWLSVLLPLKAAADFGIDLRNHDPSRTWRELYVDQ